MLMKSQPVSQDLRYRGQKGSSRQAYENTQVMLAPSRPQYAPQKKMLRMKDDPAMCMKTQGRATKYPSTKRAIFHETAGFAPLIAGKRGNIAVANSSPQFENCPCAAAHRQSAIQDRQSRVYQMTQEPQSLAPAARLSPCFRPKLRRRQHGHDFEFNEVLPMRRPGAKQFRIGRLHDLKTANPARLYPACVVSDTLWEHSAAALKSLMDSREAARLEILDDHEEHVPKSKTKIN